VLTSKRRDSDARFAALYGTVRQDLTPEAAQRAGRGAGRWWVLDSLREGRGRFPRAARGASLSRVVFVAILARCQSR